MIRFNTGDTNFNTIIKFWINNETNKKKYNNKSCQWS